MRCALDKLSWGTSRVKNSTEAHWTTHQIEPEKDLFDKFRNSFIKFIYLFIYIFYFSGSIWRAAENKFEQCSYS